MALAAFLAELQAEASCPMCLDYLRDPVTTDCGHNFCGSCIRQCWEDLQDVFPCPVCLHHCPDYSLKRNPQLCHMSDIVKQLPTTRSKRRWQEEKALCEQHSQVLDLFCEKDLELLCPQCRVTSEHRDHLLMPIEQAAASLRKRLKSYIEPLRKQTEDAEMGRDAQLSTSIALRTKYIGLQKVIDAFKAELTLDPETAHPNLIISEDRKGVAYGKRTQNVPSNPRRFTSYPAVLSAEGFAAALHTPSKDV
ncbi:putative tripartite motif-containing protein 61 [Cynocephalus volans]|uniref:putative tripartite motif-containing protein 61 n=1 Tax=Cynocephalus volans TaxID=110931 RepID=UPI002FCCB01D